MKKINEKVTKQRIIMIVFVLLFPLGIVSVALGATHNIIPLPIIGGVMVMSGFYGGPISIIVYINYRIVQKVAASVIEKKDDQRYSYFTGNG